MDIRIGNDICVQIPISEFGPIDPDNIKEIRCAFINLQNAWLHDYKFHPASHCSTQYTIRNHGHYLYNMHPCNMNMHHTNNDPYCGSIVCNNTVLENRFDSYCSMSSRFINAYFPAEFLKNLGSYKCVFEIKVAEEGWDYDDLHTYTANYEHVFDLKNNGIQGRTIIINPADEKKYDTYICAIDEDELYKYEDDYTKLILISEGFRFSNFPGFKKNIIVNDTEKKIVVISVYDSLQFKIDSYVIPMTMLKLDNGYYVYISDDLYSNKSMNIQITDTKYSNPIEERGEWVTVIENDRYNITSDKQTIPANGGTVKLTITRSYDKYKQREVTVNGEHLRYDKQLVLSYNKVPVTEEITIKSNTDINWTGTLTQNYHIFNIDVNNTLREHTISFVVYVNGSIVGGISLTQNNITDNPGDNPGTDNPGDNELDDNITYGEWEDKIKNKKLILSLSSSTISSSSTNLLGTVSIQYTSYKERTVIINGVVTDTQIADEITITKFVNDYIVVETGIEGARYDGIINSGRFVLTIPENNTSNERFIEITVSCQGLHTSTYVTQAAGSGNDEPGDNPGDNPGTDDPGNNEPGDDEPDIIDIDVYLVLNKTTKQLSLVYGQNGYSGAKLRVVYPTDTAINNIVFVSDEPIVLDDIAEINSIETLSKIVATVVKKPTNTNVVIKKYISGIKQLCVWKGKEIQYSENDFTTEEPIPLTPIAYIGLIDGTKSNFTELTSDELIQNSEIIYTKNASMTVNKDIFYALIHNEYVFDNVSYTDGGFTSVVKQYGMDCVHEAITIGDNVYYVYGYRSNPPKGLVYTINIKG